MRYRFVARHTNITGQLAAISNFEFHYPVSVLINRGNAEAQRKTGLSSASLRLYGYV
jgi:hypothetical protein